MVKTDNKRIHAPLVTTGYILFALLIVGVLLTTVIPWGHLLVSTAVQSPRYNMALFLVALTIGAFLPVLLGYLIGGNAIKSKSTLSHHFNGVLFGLLAYWIMTICAVLLIAPSRLFSTDLNTGIVIANLLPSAIIAIVAVALTIAHVRSRQAQRDILTYKPFTVLLILATMALPVWSLVYSIARHDMGIDFIISEVALVALVAISYATLRKTKLSVYEKVAWSFVSVSIFSVMTFVSGQLISVITDYILYQPDQTTYIVLQWVSLGVALVGWSVYWMVQAKGLAKK